MSGDVGSFVACPRCGAPSIQWPTWVACRADHVISTEPEEATK